MEVRPISIRLLRGMLTPAIRAMCLPLALFVTWVLTDHQHDPAAADHLALLAHGLDRGSYLQVRPILWRDCPSGPRRWAGEPWHAQQQPLRDPEMLANALK